MHFLHNSIEEGCGISNNAQPIGVRRHLDLPKKFKKL
jgi:hypothetical protein